MSDQSAEKRERPLSPHLQVYKPQLTSFMSILNRITGVALVVGSLLVVWWLLAAATSEDAYNSAMAIAQTRIGTIMLFWWSLALFYHLTNGVRHLFWDAGRLMDIKSAYKAGYVVMLATAILTMVTWYSVFTN